MKQTVEVISIMDGGEQRWTCGRLYRVTVAATGEHDNRVSEIHVDERTARALTVGRKCELVLRPK